MKCCHEYTLSVLMVPISNNDGLAPLQGPPGRLLWPHKKQTPQMSRTFSPCCNIETRQMMWAIYINSEFMFVEDCVNIAKVFAHHYMEDVK